MVSAREIARPPSPTADLSQLLADPAALLHQLGACDEPLTITRHGRPVAVLWRYEPSPVALVGLNAQGEWVAESLEDTEADFDASVEAGELRADFTDLLSLLAGADCEILITESGAPSAVLASHRDQPAPITMSPDEWRAVKQEIWRGAADSTSEGGAL